MTEDELNLESLSNAPQKLTWLSEVTVGRSMAIPDERGNLIQRNRFIVGHKNVSEIIVTEHNQVMIVFSRDHGNPIIVAGEFYGTLLNQGGAREVNKGGRPKKGNGQ